MRGKKKDEVREGSLEKHRTAAQPRKSHRGIEKKKRRTVDGKRAEKGATIEYQRLPSLEGRRKGA